MSLQKVSTAGGAIWIGDTLDWAGETASVPDGAIAINIQTGSFRVGDGSTAFSALSDETRSVAASVRHRYALASAWTTADITLGAGEFGIESDTGKVKIGDGTQSWTELDYHYDPASMTGARDWTADLVSQAEAEAGTATAPRKWSALRVQQAVAKALSDFEPETDWQDALDAKADSTHQHTIAQVTGLQTALNGLVNSQQLSDGLNTKAPAAVATTANLSRAIANGPYRASKATATSALGGAPASRAALTVGTDVQDADLGACLQIAGATDVPASPGYLDVAPASVAYVADGSTWRAVFEWRRTVDPVDPLSDGIELRVRNQSESFAQISDARMGDVYATEVSDGVKRVVVTVSKSGDADYQPPATAIYSTLYLRVYGTGQTLRIGSMDVAPVPVAGDIVPGGGAVTMTDAERTKLTGIQAGAQVNAVTTVAGKTGAVTLAKGDVGLSDVDNTDDAGKPVSTAQAAENDRIDRKANAVTQDATGTLKAVVYGDATDAEDTPLARAVADVNGNAIEALATDGTHRVVRAEPVAQAFGDVITVKGGAYPIEYRSGSASGALVGYVDHNGRFHWAAASFNALMENGIRVATQSDVAWQAVERAAMAWREGVRATPIAGVQYPTAQINHIVGFGQSLARGYECHPVISTTALTGVFMLGDSVHGSGANTWLPITTINGTPASFRPAVARVLNDGDADFLTDTQIAALAYGDDNAGETPLLAAVNAFAKMYADHWQTATPRDDLVVTDSSQGGQSIAVLNDTRFERFGDAVDAVHAEAGSQSYCCTAVTYQQGNSDYSGAMTEATYVSEWADLCAAIDARLTATASQALPPVKFMTQCVATSATDANAQAIGMAQWRVASGRKDTVLVGPDYHVTDKGIHLASNGSRWIGEMAGKVMDRVLNKREGWEPLSPYEVFQDPSDPSVIHAVFAVPVAPLQWRDFYEGHTATMRVDRGFGAVDDTGAMTLTTPPEIVGPATVRITLPRVPDTGLRLRYAGEFTQDPGGGGNLFDSDAAVSSTVYEYVTNMAAQENVTALVGKPYPLNNACIGFDVAVPFTRADLALT